jgi:hypothetical protein
MFLFWEISNTSPATIRSYVTLPDSDLEAKMDGKNKFYEAIASVRD